MNAKRAITEARQGSQSKAGISAEIGKMVREKRNETGLQLKEVAKYIGVSPLVLEAYESGVKRIPMNHIYALSNCLDISPAKIMRLLSPVKKK